MSLLASATRGRRRCARIIRAVGKLAISYAVRSLAPAVCPHHCGCRKLKPLYTITIIIAPSSLLSRLTVVTYLIYSIGYEEGRAEQRKACYLGEGEVSVCAALCPGEHEACRAAYEYRDGGDDLNRG